MTLLSALFSPKPTRQMQHYYVEGSKLAVGGALYYRKHGMYPPHKELDGWPLSSSDAIKALISRVEDEMQQLQLPALSPDERASTLKKAQFDHMLNPVSSLDDAAIFFLTSLQAIDLLVRHFDQHFPHYNPLRETVEQTCKIAMPVYQEVFAHGVPEIIRAGFPHFSRAFEAFRANE